MRYNVKNQTGETWPAYGVARLGDVLLYDGVNSDVPLYDLKKPDGNDGIYIVNGSVDIATGTEGTAIHYSIAEYVFVDSETVAVGDIVGAKSGQWSAAKSANQDFRCTDSKNTTTKIAPVVALSSGGGSSSSSGCPCTCISAGDIIVNGVETSSKWTVPMTEQAFSQTNGWIIFPAGSYTIVWDTGTSTWTLDIGSYLTSFYNNGTSATSATTMDGTLTMEWIIGSAPTLKLCVTGTVPPRSGA